MPGHKTGVFQWEAQAVAAATKDSSLGHSAGNTDREDGASGGPGRDNETRVSLHLFDSGVGPFWGAQRRGCSFYLLHQPILGGTAAGLPILPLPSSPGHNERTFGNYSSPRMIGFYLRKAATSYK